MILYLIFCLLAPVFCISTAFSKQWIFGPETTTQPLPTETHPGGTAHGCIAVSSEGNYYSFYGESIVGVQIKARNTVYLYNISTSTLQKISGSTNLNDQGNNSFPGIFHPDAAPKAKASAACTTNSNRTSFFSFGGRIRLNQDQYDLWEYSFQLNQWKLIAGSGGSGNPVYGVKGTPDILNKPGSRYDSAIAYINDEIWIAHGFNGLNRWFADIWRYQFGIGWTWMYGPTNNEPNGNYVDFGVWSTSFEPRGRHIRSYFSYAERYIVFFGGMYDADVTNDAYEYDTVTNQIRWFFGNDTTVIANQGSYSSYTTFQEFDPTNTPGFRYDSSIFSASNDSLSFFIFSGNPDFDAYSDLWYFNGSQWAYWGGSFSSFPVRGEVKQVSTGYSPGVRAGSSYTSDAFGNMIIFGGYTGFDDNYLEDAWIFYFDSLMCDDAGFKISSGNLPNPIQNLSPYTVLCYCNSSSTLNTTKPNVPSNLLVSTCIDAPTNVQAGGVVGSVCMAGYIRISSNPQPSDPCIICPINKICPGGSEDPYCIPNYYSINVVESDCVPCVGNAKCSGVGPPSCYSSFYHSEVEEPCIECPKNASCSGGQALPVSDKGFFSSRVKKFVFIPCILDDSCLGNDTCATGYSDYLCSRCSTGYFQSFGKCTRCTPFMSNFWIILIFIFFIILYGSIYSISVILKKQSPIPIFFDFLQCSAIIGSISVPELPQFFSSFNEVLSLVFFDFTIIFPPECFIESSDHFYLRKFFLLVLFFILCGFYFLFYSLHIFIRKQNIKLFSVTENSNSKLIVVSDWIYSIPLDQIKYWYLGGLNLSCYVFFPLLLRSFLGYFECNYLEDGTYSLESDPAQLCYQEPHVNYIAPFILVLVLIGLVYPLFALRQTYQANTKWIQQGKPIPQYFLATWGFYFALCKPHFAYFDILLLFRRFLIAMWAVFFSSSPLAATFLIMITVLLLVIFQAMLQPYNSPVLNQSFSLLGFALFLQCLIMVGYASYSSGIIVCAVIILLSPAFLPFSNPGVWMKVFTSVSKQDIVNYCASQAPEPSPSPAQSKKFRHRRTSSFELALPNYSFETGDSLSTSISDLAFSPDKSDDSNLGPTPENSDQDSDTPPPTFRLNESTQPFDSPSNSTSSTHLDSLDPMPPAASISTEISTLDEQK